MSAGGRPCASRPYHSHFTRAYHNGGIPATNFCGSEKPLDHVMPWRPSIRHIASVRGGVMGASGRRIILELKRLTVCQCQIHGNLPIMWHSENCESSSVRMKSNRGRHQDITWLFSREAPSRGS